MVAMFRRAGRPLAWVIVVLALGLGLRCYHYLRNPSVWHDEAALLVNVIAKDFGEQLGPLFYSEAAPPLFLWVERAIFLALGDGTFALRLLPFVASCVALLALFVIARRLLTPAAVVWLLLLFACSDRLLWHACEAKPYALDVLIAVGLLATFVGKRGQIEFAEERPPSQTVGTDGAGVSLFRRLLLFAALSPVLVFLSFPACFLLGGAALALLPAVWRARSGRVWAGYVLFGAALCGSFVLLYLGPVLAQKNERMLWCWLDHFPPWDRPWLVPFAALVRLTELFRYASEPVGNVLAVFAVLGAARLWRDGQRRVLAFLVLPVALTVLAWLCCQYPLGPSRVVVFAAPAALLLVAVGIPPALAWLRARWRYAPALVACLLLFPAAQAAYRVVVPWSRPDSATPADFVMRVRQPSDAVIGTLWEHTYYFRHLGPLYRHADPKPREPATLPPAAALQPLVPSRSQGETRSVRRVWILHRNDEDGEEMSVPLLRGAGSWRVANRYGFRDVTAVCLERTIELVRERAAAD